MTNTTRPTYEELVDALEDTAAALDNVLTHHAEVMTPEDATTRRRRVTEAQALVDRVAFAPAPSVTPPRSAEAFPYLRALHAAGVYAGPRDPQRNRAFAGTYMVADDLDTGPTDDASTGGYCTVGDDLFALAVTACNDLDLEVADGDPDPAPRVQMVCHTCHGTEVTRTAEAEWNVEAQRWQLINVYDDATCNGECQGETTLDEVAYIPDPS